MKFVSRFLRKKYDKELVYLRKCLNTKIEYYNDKWPTNLHYNEIPSKENIEYVCFPIVLIDYFYEIGKNHYPQACFEEYKFAKEKKISIIIMMIIMIIIITKARFEHKIKISSNKFDESDESDDYDEENGAD